MIRENIFFKFIYVYNKSLISARFHLLATPQVSLPQVKGVRQLHNFSKFTYIYTPPPRGYGNFLQ